MPAPLGSTELQRYAWERLWQILLTADEATQEPADVCGTEFDSPDLGASAREVSKHEPLPA